MTGAVRTAALLLLAAAAAGPPVAVAGQSVPVEVTVLDVGQGDAVVVRAPGGEVLMVDAGPDAPLRYLARLGVDSLALLVATHPHADHVGGMQSVLTARPVDLYLDDGRAYDTDLHRTLVATLDRLGGVSRVEADEQRLRVGALSVEVLPAVPTESPDPPSVGLLVRYGDFSLLLPGDAEEAQLDEWTRRGLVGRVTLLKASRHGGEDGVTEPFMDAARPEVVAISVGADNGLGHPRPEALTLYGTFARHVLRTDVSGHLTVRGFPDGRYEIFTGADLDDLRPLRETTPRGTQRDGDSPGGAEAGGAEAGGAEADGGRRRAWGAGSTGPAAGRLEMEVVVDAPGARSGDLNRDFAAVRNVGERSVDLSGWRLCDLSTRCFRFPPGATLPPGRRVVVYTGYGLPDGTSFFMNNDRRVWNEDGDEASLYDADGRLVLRHVY